MKVESTERKKILFIIPALYGGGAERVFSIILKYLNREKFIPVLVLIKKEGEFLKNISSDVEIIDLKSSRTLTAWFKIIRVIWKENPDVVFSTLGHLNLIIAMFLLVLPRKTKYIARETSIVSINNPNEGFPLIFDFLFKTVYKNFDQIVCQSKYMQNDLTTHFKIPPEKTIVINNPVDIFDIQQKIQEKEIYFEKDKTYFVAVSRLSAEKGIDNLIKAFALVKKENARLCIIGEGVLKEELIKLTHALGIQHKVNFLGFSENPYKYMHLAKAVIITSHYEGFPNVAIEANACGTPVIAFDSPGAIGEIIQNGINGWLVENLNVEKLAMKMEEVADLSLDGKKIIEFVTNKYQMNLIVKKYEDIFDSGNHY